VKVPETTFFAGAATTGACACAVFVAAGFGLLGFVVELLFAGAADFDAVGVAELFTPTGSTAVPGSAIEVFSVEVNVGGVIAMTAPNPPTVPVAINIARFISVPSLNSL
jgi:hypothetical protein